ncbi:MAG: PleD family two-component system response regulator [Notoacmeibacter sp.]|nr:PleD family two-component system response regulator [Notoacmeibacter sp.]MCC0031718.1 PleD family two-component system response regulator [Brucellaceae bacterium]
MTARILVVDDIPANVRLLEARLLAEYFEVLTASNGHDALAICESERVDVILLDIMMPGIDGFEVCRRLKADPQTAHIPVVMVTALDQPADRVRGLEVGADDFLTKPVNDLQLMTRVKSLVRLKGLSDELRLRAATTRNIGIEELLNSRAAQDDGRPASFLLIDERDTSAARLEKMLGETGEVTRIADPQQGFFEAVNKAHDAIIVATGFSEYDPLRLCSHLRSIDFTRFTPIILVAEADEEEVVTRGLELGVNDYVTRPVEPQEFKARLATQVRRKRYNDSLRASVAQTIEMAVTDPLTGMHNRRYLDSHLERLFERARSRGRPLSVMMTDLDRFKSVNDTHGHDAGDEVIREFARRVRRHVRGADLACRYGGEEFAIIMPDTPADIAHRVAERLRAQIEGEAFDAGQGRILDVTVSIGVATISGADTNASAILKRADEALYEAKKTGRNKVVAQAA